MAKKTKKTDDLKPQPAKPELTVAPKIEDPIGDETDGEASTALGPAIGPEGETEAAEDKAETAAEAERSPYAESDPEAETESEDSAETKVSPEHDEDEPQFNPKPRPPAKLERLQKILAQAGVASRRKAEEMIEQGRIQVNGKVVTELGTKADAARDHIRVDGKLLQGAERLRYFVLNKPRGFVTTVKDPEGRPTVMQFFDKMRERLYPVGRLDYMSEGLLLVTNDGELANRLTRAAAGVEKTYLVKVAGQPTEAELDILRAGVAIERGKPGSDRVRTSPARIRQVRQGDNPWYEVVLIEGRNRELRKMFEEIGHFVEKIRRVGYGPLVLDQEPGNLRELDAQELELLRKAADGTLRTPKSKEVRRRNAMDAGQLPTIAPRTNRPGATKPLANRFAASGPGDYRPKRSFETPIRPTGEAFRPPAGRPVDDRAPSRGPARADDRPRRTATGGPPKFGAPRPAHPPAGKPYGDKPAVGRSYGDKTTGRTFGDKPGAGRTFPPKPAWKKPEAQKWPPYKRPSAYRPPAPRRNDDEIATQGPKAPSRLHIEPIEHSDRPSRPNASRSNAPYPHPDRSSTGRSSSPRPFRGEGGLSRPFTTSSGKPRAGGPRPSSKPGKSTGRSYAAGPRRPFESKPEGSGKRPFRRDEAEGSSAPRPEKRTGWKPKPSFGGPPKPGGSSKSGYKARPAGSGPKRTGPRPSGKRPGGTPGGKKRT